MDKIKSSIIKIGDGLGKRRWFFTHAMEDEDEE